MTPGSDSSSDSNDSADRLTSQQRELLEEVASWDEEKCPLAEHAQQILQVLEGKSE